MAQFGRPDGDISVGLWSPYPSSPTTLFDKIDEVTPNGDTDYIYSSNDEDECEASIGSVNDPGVGTGHKIRCYAQCPLGSGQPEAMWIALVENGTIRGQSFDITVDRNSYVMIEYTLSEAEANAIGNYANLRLRFHIAKVNGGEPIQITQAEFECPDAGLDLVKVIDESLQLNESILRPRGMKRIQNEAEQLSEGIGRFRKLVRIIGQII